MGRTTYEYFVVDVASYVMRDVSFKILLPDELDF